MAGGKVSLAELMGKAGRNAENKKFTMEDLPELLGERMPEIKPTQVGRFRLVSSLKQRFGAGFRNIRAAREIISDFDNQMNLEIKVRKLKNIKLKR